MLTRDPDIRRALLTHLRDRHADDCETRIVEEMCICQSRARADLAVINGQLVGYEIKSAADRLDRLPSQARYYSQIFDRVVIVCAPRHLKTLLRRLPSWWGVWAAELDGAAVRLALTRKGELNPGPNPAARVQLLWRDEMIQELRELGLDTVGGRATRRELVLALLEQFSEDELAARVRHRLCERRARSPRPGA